MPGRLRLGIAALASLAWLLASPAAAETNLKGDRIPAEGGDWILRPVNHATVMLQWKDQILCVDPVGGAQRFAGLPAPTLILVTDIHGDHLSSETLAALGGGRTPIIAPAAVREQLGGELRARTEVLAHGAKITRHGLTIEAVPAYNLAADRLQYHPKGRANGYLLTAGGPARATEAVSIYIYRYGFQSFNLGYASAASYIMILIMLGVALVLTRMIGRSES